VDGSDRVLRKLDSSLTIRGLRVRPLDLAVAKPVETAAGIMRTAPVVLIDLHTQEGITGRSYVRCYTPVALAATARLISDLEGVIAGLAAHPVRIETELRRRFRLLGPQGLTGIAVSGIEQAVWDACARARGVSLTTLLGGRAQPVTAYAALRTMGAKSAAAEAGEAAARGFGGVKLKVGAGDLAQDLTAIRAVRSAIGDDIGLMVDYNQSLSVDEALLRIGPLDSEGLAWIEEPTSASDHHGHARIAAAARTPIQLGENWWGPADTATSIAARASDLVTLDVMKLGGVGGWLRAAGLAEGAGLPASSHAFPELSVQLLPLTPTCDRLEYLDHVGGILTEPVQVRDGRACPPAGPGNGIEWDESVLARLAA
jgi:mandelate racemase